MVLRKNPPHTILNTCILTNEQILERMSAGKVLIKTIRIQKYRFCYHIRKDKEVENMVIMGNGEGELRKQG